MARRETIEKVTAVLRYGFAPVLRFFFGVGLALLPFMAKGTEFTSTNFKIIDPVIQVGGGRSTSASFQTEQSIGQPALGLSTSQSYQLQGGSLYFPAPTAAAAAAVEAEAAAAGGGGGSLLPVLFPVVAPFFPPVAIPAACPDSFTAADLNCDGQIGIKDLSVFLFFSAVPAPNRADLNRDSLVNTKDLSILFSKWNERLFAFVPEAQFGIPAERREAARPSRQFAIVGEAARPAAAASFSEQAKAPGFLQKIYKIPGIFKKFTETPGFIYRGVVKLFQPLLFWR